jgi:molybdopterin-containing oxidoreductase family iron-sulfur binding subunit
MQPVISPVFNTRQMAETLLKWSGSSPDIYELIRSYWTENMMPLQTEFSDPVVFFDKTVEKGVFEPGGKAKLTVSPVVLLPSGPFIPEKINDSQASFEVVLYEPVAMGEGRQSNNPWLQELPDPVTRICWDNFASISVLQAGEIGLKDGDLIDLGGVILPVRLQPGQAYGTISAGLGYGRRICGKVGEGVGVMYGSCFQQKMAI